MLENELLTYCEVVITAVKCVIKFRFMEDFQESRNHRKYDGRVEEQGKPEFRKQAASD